MIEYHQQDNGRWAMTITDTTTPEEFAAAVNTGVTAWYVTNFIGALLFIGITCLVHLALRTLFVTLSLPVTIAIAALIAAYRYHRRCTALEIPHDHP